MESPEAVSKPEPKEPHNGHKGRFRPGQLVRFVGHRDVPLCYPKEGKLVSCGDSSVSIEGHALIFDNEGYLAGAGGWKQYGVLLEEV